MLTVKGVRKIISRESLSGIEKQILFGICISDQPPLAIDKVRHAGEVVAAVIANSPNEAEAAVKKIQIDIEPLPFFIDPIEAAKSDLLIHERNGTYKQLPSYVPMPNTNIFYKYQLKKGDFQDPFEQADVIAEIDDFDYPLVSHAALEPQGAFARWDTTGELHIWSSSQSPFVVRELLSEMFHLPMNKIHIHVPYVGGGFGGKSDYTIEPLLAVLARFVPGYHLRFVLTRKEVFIGSLLGRGMKGRMKIGAKKDGTFVGIEAEQYFSIGAYGDTGINIVLAAGHNCVGPYKFDNCNLKSFGVYTNTTPVGAFRGYGHPEGQFMVERLIEQLAIKLEIDPLTLRKQNFLKAGDTNSLGMTISNDNGSVMQCFDQMIKALDEKPLAHETEDYLYGRGYAALVKSPVQAANAASCVFLKFNEDLSVNVSVSAVEIGQGSLTVLGQIAAETLRIPVESVRVNYEINTQLSPYEWQTVASMTTMRAGNAIISASEKAIEKFKTNASYALNCTVDELAYDGKKVYKRDNKDHFIPLSKLVHGYQFPNGKTLGDPILTTGTSVVRDVTFPDLDTGQYQPYEWTFGAQGCDIQIEKATGKIKVLRFCTALDVGKVINPETAKGQVMGGVMQGIGQALMEKITYNSKGIMKTDNLLKYKIPSIKDMPEWICIFIENEQPNGPYGARPLAEHPVIAPPSSILNAIQSATGTSLTQLPATPDKVLKALEQRRNI